MADELNAAQPAYKLDNYRETYKLYEDGKHRRYELLFAVNGGGFAVGSLFKENNVVELLGNLTISQLAIGMAVFTVAMYADIMVFGIRMREIAHAVGQGTTRGIFSKI